MRRSARVRVFSIFSVGLVVISAASASRSVAAAVASKRPQVQKVRRLPHTTVPLGHAATTDPTGTAVRGATSWPAAGSSDVTVPASASKPGGPAAGQRASTLPILLTGGAGSGTRMRVQLRDEATAAKVGVNGVLFTLSRLAASAAAMSVAVDYSSFRNAGGANFGQRLHLVSLPACALTTPAKSACRVQTPLLSTNDANAELVSATVGGISTTRSGAQTSASLAATPGSSVVVAAVAGASSPNGSFKASSLAPSGSWSVSGASGSFQWSYPITVPPPAAGGDVAPGVALSYNSGSVDGRIASTNNQPSWVGEGWDYSPGYIERTYRTCADDTTLPAASQTGDQCWAGQIVTMNLGGHTTALVRDDASGTWHPEADDGSKVELIGAGGGAYQGEYWRVTTVDGVQYYFGRNILPGGTTATATNSAWTEPVYGAHSGQPCNNAAGFAQSRCTQAWRWNLDFVEDPHHNATAYYYTAETNYYGVDNATSPVAYTRGGYLTRIDYGLRDENNTIYAATAPERVSFTVAERCIPDSTFDCATTKFTTANASHWPDTPVDQQCASTGTCNNHAPTFWSRKRLTTITSAYFNSAVYKTLDSYALTQSFSTQGDPELQLNSIVRTGFAADGTSIVLPAVSFGINLMDNRVLGYNNQPSMAHWRLTQITTETGQTIVIKYSGDDSQTGRAKPLCTGTTVPADPSQDTTECFPVYWTPPFNTTPILDYFHKYVITEVDVDEPHAIAPDRYTTYTYLGDPAWHYDDNEVVKAANRTYGQFRGYGKVETRTGNQNAASNGHPDQWTLSTATYYRGMNGDTLPSGTRTANVTDSLGETVPDNNLYADTAREVQTFNGTGGAQVSTTITTMSTVATTATRARTGLPALTANITAATTQRAYTTLAGGGTRNTSSSYGYDSLGRLTHQTDSGTGVADVCTTTSYAENTTTWIRNRVSEKITSAQTCPTSGDPSPILTDTRTYYDGSTTLGAVPGAGDATRSDTATDNTGGTLHFAKATATFDASGRPASTTTYTSAADAIGRTTTIAYTPADGGPLTKTVTTNAATQTTTTLLDPGRGVTTETVDVAGHKTDALYDALGRVVAVWQPGQTKPASGTSGATTTYAYLLRTTGPLAVTTNTLIDPGNGAGPGYKTAISLYDAFGALRQTQTDAVGGGRVITDSFTDSHGWVVTTNNRWVTSGTPATTLITTADSGIDSRTTTDHDGTGRTTLSTEYQGTTAKWSTTTVYSGDRTTVIPPTGGVETTTVTDARNNTTELDQWTTPPTITGGVVSGGTAQQTTYHYTPLGQQDQMTTPAGTPLAATWTTSYDLAGRAVSKTDPDTGITTSTYDDAGELTSTTDARNQVLAYTYDALGRKTQEHADSTTGPLLASWTYDTLQAGRLTSSIRYATDGNYTVAATGYDAAGNPTGTSTQLPASMTALGYAAAYTTRYNWTTTHLMASQVTPSGGGLPGETITNWYDSFGDPNGATGVNAYVSAASYSPYGEANQYSLGVNVQVAWLTLSRDAQTRRITTANLSAQTAIPQLENVDYTYDPAGNTTRSVDAEGGGPNVPIETQCYAYDPLDQLTAAWSATDNCATAPTSDSNAMVGGPQPYWTSWAVDAASGRSGQTVHALPGAGGGDAVTTYTAGVSGHAHALAATTTSGPGAGSTSYGYDPAGDTTVRAGIPGGDQALVWDVEDRLASITSPAGTISYTYAADGAELVRHDPGSTTLFLPGEDLTRDNTTGRLTGTRYYTVNGAVVGERVGGGNPYYLFTDPHGSTQTVIPTAPSGTQTPIRRQLDPYGNPLGATTGGTWPDQHGFLNKPQNPTTGLVDLGARSYDPTLGRFLSVDPLLDPNDPQAANGYSYADNNPITKTDPSGTICAVGEDNANCGSGGHGGGDTGSGAPPLPPGGNTSGSAGSGAGGGAAASLLGTTLATAPNKYAYYSAYTSAVDQLFRHYHHDYAQSVVDNLTCNGGCGLTNDAAMLKFAKILCGQTGIVCNPGKSGYWAAVMTSPYSGTKLTAQAQQWVSSSGELGALTQGAVLGSGGGVAELVPAACGGGESFTPETKIVMADGSTKRLDHVTVGDRVEATEPTTGANTTQTVSAVWVNHDTDLMDVTVHTAAGTSTIHTTAHHLFWDPTTSRWVPADTLHPGQHLHSHTGAAITVTATAPVRGAADMWDLTITTTHDFYIATERTSALVHNCPSGADGAHNELHAASRGVDADHVWENGDLYTQVREDQTRLVKVLSRGNGFNDVVIRELDGTPVTSMVISDRSLEARIADGRWQ